MENCVLLQELLQTPPDFERVNKALSTGEYSPKQVTEIGYQYVAECWNEDLSAVKDSQYCEEFCYYWREPVAVPERHSFYLYDVFSLLLEFGLNPNHTVPGDFSLMEYVFHVVNEYIAADTLNLLLENGGNPNLDDNGETPFYEKASGDMFFDAIEQRDRRRYDSLVHCWMVLLAHGGKLSNGVKPVDVFMEYSDNEKKEFDIRKLKDHRNYYIGITGSEEIDIHVFDRRTNWEVARL